MRKALGGRKKSVLTEDICAYIEVEKLNQLSSYSSELQKRLLLDCVVLPVELPTQSSITQFLCSEILMTRKKISQVPIESKTDLNVNKQNEFLDEISRLDPLTMHFFDETSMKRTEGNRRYGNLYIREPAIEYQKYASNATYTVNLLH